MNDSISFFFLKYGIIIQENKIVIKAPAQPEPKFEFAKDCIVNSICCISINIPFVKIYLQRI